MKEENFFITVIDGRTTTKQLIVVDLESTIFEGLRDKNIFAEDCLASVAIAAGKSEQDYDLTISDGSTTFSCLVEFGKRKYIEVIIKRPQISVPDLSSEQRPPSAFDVLMGLSRKYDLLPPQKKRPENNSTDKVYNKVLELLKEEGVGFLNSNVEDIGKYVVKSLTSVLWYLDPHHEKFHNRGFEIPDCFGKISGFYQWNVQHKKKPQIVAEQLTSQLCTLVSVSTLPFFLNPQFNHFKEKLDKLANSIQRYLDYLKKALQKNSDNSNKITPIRSLNDNWTLVVHEKTTFKEGIPPQYLQLINLLSAVDMYQPISTNEIEPINKKQRFDWYDQIKLPFAFAVYTYRFGNFLGNLVWIWKVFGDPDKRNDNSNIHVICEIKDQIPVFSTRAMRKELISKYSQATKMKPAILRSLYKFITNDASAAESKEEALINTRVEFALNSDDPDVIMDLRSLNGRPENKKFDLFWEELEKLLKENSIVHERRHHDIGYMPFAISVRDLISQVKQRLPDDCAIPSESWVKLNFQPSNPYVKSAMNYTGRFHVKYKVQMRLLRSKHVDADYCYSLFKLMKSMAIRFRDAACFICVDDKAIIPVGEPSNPISTNVRSHHRGISAATENDLLSLDHDYSVCGIVPSVLFLVEIPENENDSFYNGQVHVTVKDKIFEASSALRHVTENVKILRQVCSKDLVSLDKSILFMYSDGGPDHRTTFQSVQVSLILKFILLDLDMLIAVRTAPCQSYNNPAERIMSLLNLALQNVSLCRTAMDAYQEVKFKRNFTLKKIRSQNDEILKDGITKSMESVIGCVKERFSRLVRNSTAVEVHDGGTKEEMEDMLMCLSVILRNDVPVDVESSPKITKLPGLAEFMETHCRLRQYSFQVKKCLNINCAYCQINPPRHPEFKDITWLPDPVLSQDSIYMEFDELYGTETDDLNRPSLKDKPQPTENDRKNKKMFTKEKARSFIICCECGKRRVVYSLVRLTPKIQKQLHLIQDTLMYTCGSTLFNDTEMVVREGINCLSTIELPYYSASTVKFDDVCFHCGDGNTCIPQDYPVLSELLTNNSIVRPICENCLKSGKIPATRNAVKTRKRKAVD